MTMMVVNINTEVVEIFDVNLSLYQNVRIRCGKKDHLFSRYELIFLLGALCVFAGVAWHSHEMSTGYR